MRLFHHWRTFVMAGTAAVSLAACASNKAEPSVAPTLDAQARGEVLDLLGKSAARAADARHTLALIERSRLEPAVSPIDETDLPPELKRQATISWSGPGEEAARRIAEIIGYSFQVVGNPAGTSPMVHLSVMNVSAVKALENIGLQVQPQAQLAIDPNLKRIEYRYVNSGSVTGLPAHTGGRK